MSRITKIAVCIILAASFAGCRKEPPAAPPATNPPAPAAGNNANTAEIEAAFASLSAEDRALAEKQRNCPVGGGPLGSMGTPIKVAVAGQEVFICCEGCKDPLLEKPAEHLAKIGLKPATETAPQ